MVKCAKCSADVAGSECCLTCAECKNSFHPACTRTGSSQNLTKLKLKSWKCDICKGDSVSISSVEDGNEDRRSILEAIGAVKNDINSNIDSVKGSISSLTEEFRQLRTEVGAVKEDQEKLARRCRVLEEDNGKIRGEVQELRLRLLDAEQHSRCANIEIQGLPYTKGENVYTALNRIADVIGVNYGREDVSIAHRLRLYSKKHAHPPLIVQFISRSIKEDWMNAARSKKGLNSSHLSSSLQPSAIFINEHLTGPNKELLGCARRMMKERKLHYAGYHNGKVLVKRREGEEAVRVTSLRDLDVFDKPAEEKK